MNKEVSKFYFSQTQSSPDGERCTSETVRIICECVNTLLTDIHQGLLININVNM